MKHQIEKYLNSITCPLLNKNKWTFNTPKIDSVFLYGIKEMFNWYSRRGGRITSEALLASISAYMRQKSISISLKNIYEHSFRHFLLNSYYQEITQPILNYKTQLNISNKSIETVVPIVSTLEGRICIYLYGKELLATDILSRIDVQAMILYFFLIKNASPSIIYTSMDEDRNIFERKINYTIDYLNFITQNMRKVMESKPLQHIPDTKICSICDRRNECHQTRNWLKQL